MSAELPVGSAAHGPALIISCGSAQDVIDLRHNAWVERRAVEGPKTISEIHRDAANEAMRKASSGRDFGRGQGRLQGPRATSHDVRLC